jgi:hypothetical protein
MSAKPIAGKATLGTVTDVTPLLRAMIIEMKRQEGDTSDVSAAELKAAADAFGKDMDDTQAEAKDDVIARMARSLPQGVSVDIAARRDGTKMTSTTTFAFDDVNKLKHLEVFFEQGRPSHKPFATIAVEEKDGGVVVDGMPPAITPPPGATAADLAGQGFLFALELTLPVVESNATRVEQQALIWELDGKRLQARKDGDSGWIRARFQSA